MIDYHNAKNNIQRQLLSQWQQLDLSSHPLDWVWMFYAYLLHSKKDNSIIVEGIRLLIQWGLANSTTVEGNIGAFGLAAHILRQKGLGEAQNFLVKLITFSSELLNKSLGKFSPLNDPIIFYCYILGIRGNIGNEQLDLLTQIGWRNSRFGSNKRQLLYLASLTELGEAIQSRTVDIKGIDLSELPCFHLMSGSVDWRWGGNRPTDHN